MKSQTSYIKMMVHGATKMDIFYHQNLIQREMKNAYVGVVKSTNSVVLNYFNCKTELLLAQSSWNLSNIF